MVEPMSYFLFQPMLPYWYNKDCGMCYSIYGIVHIRYQLLLIRKSDPWSGGSGYPLSPSGSYTEAT